MYTVTGQTVELSLSHFMCARTKTFVYHQNIGLVRDTFGGKSFGGMSFSENSICNIFRFCFMITIITIVIYVIIYIYN